MSGAGYPGGPFGARGDGLRASLVAAIAYDPICSGSRIEVSLEPQAVVLSGFATPEAAQRAREIVLSIVGPISIWDRMIWLHPP
ncbi:BON domain-containing protein [Shinella daejeonensis]|uniref:BON domain-containing protein n=1 Tax=Shinella daejeonensis TaxID=659017 RepID=UPI0020C7F4D5|nr:BON domain-containing protein [Shinella daejeonensis]MCP8895527.1 BON domain-containing protein [Shinella daejeonensis]